MKRFYKNFRQIYHFQFFYAKPCLNAPEYEEVSLYEEVSPPTEEMETNHAYGQATRETEQATNQETTGGIALSMNQAYGQATGEIGVETNPAYGQLQETRVPQETWNVWTS